MDADAYDDEEMGLAALDGQVFRRRSDVHRPSRSGSTARKQSSQSSLGSGGAESSHRRHGRSVKGSAKGSHKVAVRADSGSEADDGGQSRSQSQGEGEGSRSSFGGLFRSTNKSSSKGSDENKGTADAGSPHKVVPLADADGLALGEGGGDGEDQERPVVWERGYHSEDEERMHPQQSGKLAGADSVADPEKRLWAESGLEGRVVRRGQSDGPRLDSEALLDSAAHARGNTATATLSTAASLEALQSVGIHSTLHAQDWAPPIHDADFDGYARYRDSAQPSVLHRPTLI